MESKGTIVTALLASGGVLTWKGIRTGSLTPRTYAALIVAALMLLILAGFAPDLASAFAVLVFVTVLLSSAGDIATLGTIGRKAA